MIEFLFMLLIAAIVLYGAWVFLDMFPVPQAIKTLIALILLAVAIFWLKGHIPV